MRSAGSFGIFSPVRSSCRSTARLTSDEVCNSGFLRWRGCFSIWHMVPPLLVCNLFCNLIYIAGAHGDDECAFIFLQKTIADLVERVKRFDGTPKSNSGVCNCMVCDLRIRLLACRID